MAFNRFRPSAALILLPLAAAAAAQEPAPLPVASAPPAAEQPPTAAPEILVTGVRPLVVNIEEVARRCVACRRAVARLQASLAPRGRGGAPESVDEVSARPPVIGQRSPVNTSSASAAGMMQYSEAMTGARITSRGAMARRQPHPATERANARAAADRYLQNLMTYIGPIVDRELQARRAPAAYAADDPVARGIEGTDITNAVIEQMDRDHRDADLLAGPRPG